MAGPSLQGSVNVIVMAAKTAINDSGMLSPIVVEAMIDIVARQHKRTVEDILWRYEATLEAVLAGTWGPL